MDIFVRDNIDQLLTSDRKICSHLTNLSMTLFGNGRLPAGALLQTGSIVEGASIARWFRVGDEVEELEMDVMYVMGTLPQSVITLIPDKPGFLTIRYDSTILQYFHDKVRQEISCLHGYDNLSYLNPRRTRTRTVEIVHFSDKTQYTQTIFSVLFGVRFEDVQVRDVNETTGATACVEVTVRNREQHILKFGMDNVPCVALNGWPEVANEWYTRERVYPSLDIVQEISAAGCHIVPKSSKGGDEDTEWRFSFSLAEKMLAEKRSKSQNRIYTIFKILFYKYLKAITIDEEPESCLPSFHVKTVMLWICEKYPPLDQLWSDVNVDKAIKTVLGLYIEYVDSGFLPNYFMKNLNLIGDLHPELKRRLLEMLKSINACPLLYVPYNIRDVVRKVDDVSSKIEFVSSVASMWQNMEQLAQNIKSITQVFTGRP